MKLSVLRASAFHVTELVTQYEYDDCILCSLSTDTCSTEACAFFLCHRD